MKRVSVISFICLMMVLSGCGNDQYTVEKQYWQLQKQAQKVFKNPHASPPNELERIVKILEDFIQKNPQSKLAINNEFTIVQLYMVKEEYAQARKQLEKMLTKYSKFGAICSDALFLIGNSYEKEDKWNSALTQYRKIMQEYPTTLRGLNTPIYIAQHYKVKYQPDKMVVALQEAIVHYQALADKYPNSPLAYRAYNLIAQCYVELKDWQNAINSLNIIVDKYKDKIDVGGVLIDTALIYNRELKDKVKAKEALERLIKEYPRSRLIKTATNLLKELEKK